MEDGADAVKSSMVGPQKLNVELLYDPVSPLLHIDPKESKTETRRGICPLFIAASFTVVKTWKRPKCLSTGE